MTDSSLFHDEQRTIESRPPLGEELLPPVEEPSARFIIQLFVVPLVIVMVIVAVFLSVRWLVRSTEMGPEQLIRGIETGPNVARWQRAKDLADLLHDKQYPEFRQSHQAAAQLAHMLDREIDSGEMEPLNVEYRGYLARALAEIDVQDGTDVLLKAAKTNRDPREQRAQDAAIQALATRADNLQRLDPPQPISNAEVERAMLRFAEDADPLIRFQAAYALGKLGTPAATQRLEVMVNDPDAGTRYNAAVALAHRGNAKSIDTLAEMLDVNELAGVREEKAEGRTIKRTNIIGNAIGAAIALSRRNSKADLSPVIAALGQIVAANPQTLEKAYISRQVASECKVALGLLKVEK